MQGIMLAVPFPYRVSLAARYTMIEHASASVDNHLQTLVAPWESFMGRHHAMPLEAVDLDGLRIELEAIFLVGEEFMHMLALVALELNHLAHLVIVDDGAIAGELLLDHAEDLLAGEFDWKALDRRQGLTTISLLDTDMDVILRLCLFRVVLLGFGEGVERLEIFDGHKLWLSGGQI